MHIIDNYSDLVVKIELIKEQIKLTEWELEYWFGVKSDGTGSDGIGIPLGGKGSQKFGALTSITQASVKLAAISKLQEQLRFYEVAKDRMDILMESLESLDYKIAYRRIVYAWTHLEIADELGYSEQYIRRRWAKLKSNKEATDALEIV